MYFTAHVDSDLSFSVAEVSKTFKRVNPGKAVGPDGISSHSLRACTDQIAVVFIDIFNLSLSQFVVPTCIKMSTIVPVTKIVKVAELNDYSPKAPYSIIMKCFERLVRDHITSTLTNSLDPLKCGSEPHPVQLGAGLPDGATPGGEGRQQHLRYADHQHGGPTRVCVQSHPVLYSLFTHD